MKGKQRNVGKRTGGFSRRDFLKGSGAAAMAASGGALAEAQGRRAATRVVGPGKTSVKLTVNGKQHTLSVEPRTTLLEALRYQLDLTGAKPVSDDGVSGSSTVLLNDKPANASTTLAVECANKKVTTVESLWGDGKPDPVAAAFVRHDAQQCGFCTPGFVVAVKAFLLKNPKATEAEIRAGLNGNICRCGTYANVLHAVIDLVKGGGNG